jgi:AraC-like DNA-binding protein/mannose-6-phosphate isomerase-like protein (cupin superfamily)
MVKSGQALEVVAQFGFSNPDRAQLGIEVLEYAALRGRLSATMVNAVHRTDFHQLFVVTGGTGAMTIDFVEHDCAEGTLLHVGPGRILRLPRGRVDAHLVLFAPSFPPRLEGTQPLLGPFGPTVWAVPDTDRRGLRLAVEELETEYARAVTEPDSPLTVELLRQLLGALLLRVGRLPSTEDGHNASCDETFRRFQHELERSFSTTRNTGDYAARVGYSPRSLNRLCQAAAGQNAKALIDARVALEAKRLLVHTNLSAATIGQRLGFTEATNFTKFFTREAGITPRAFRERERGTDLEALSD